MFILAGTCNIAVFLKPLQKWRGSERERAGHWRGREGIGIQAVLFLVCVRKRGAEESRKSLVFSFFCSLAGARVALSTTLFITRSLTSSLHTVVFFSIPIPLTAQINAFWLQHLSVTKNSFCTFHTNYPILFLCPDRVVFLF